MEDDFELIINWMLEQTRSSVEVLKLFGSDLDLGAILDETMDAEYGDAPRVREAINRYEDDPEGWQQLIDEYLRRWDEIKLDSSE